MTERSVNLARLRNEKFDVLIVGGGINGAVAAAALACKGVKVGLIEKDDFASHTSSNSSNLVWGGIKYLESGELLLVNNLCKSRNRLMRSYPSTVKEIRFLTTIQKGFRMPVLLVYLGTLLYWVIGRFFTRAPWLLPVRKLEARDPIINTTNAQGGLEYSDCYLYDTDARFVFGFVRTALDKGCAAVNYVESVRAKRHEKEWMVHARDNEAGDEFEIRADVVINACGPWVDAHNRMSGQSTRHHHLLSRGIHLIIDQVIDRERVLAFFASDGRLFFVIPMGAKTCIGTTDVQVSSPETCATAREKQFVLDNVNRMLDLKQPLSMENVVAERCGVRPLAVEGNTSAANWMQLSRKHAIEINTAERHVSIFGGKLTDCLNIGEEIIDIIENIGVDFPFRDGGWYGEPDDHAKQNFIAAAQSMNLDALTDASSPEPLSQRLWRRYGEQAHRLLHKIREDVREAELLIPGAEYLRCEITLAAEREMITRLDDLLRRRSTIAQIKRRQDIVQTPALRSACDLLFGNNAETKFREYCQAQVSP